LTNKTQPLGCDPFFENYARQFLLCAMTKFFALPKNSHLRACPKDTHSALLHCSSSLFSCQRYILAKAKI